MEIGTFLWEHEQSITLLILFVLGYLLLRSKKRGQTITHIQSKSMKKLIHYLVRWKVDLPKLTNRFNADSAAVNNAHSNLTEKQKLDLSKSLKDPLGEYDKCLDNIERELATLRIIGPPKLKAWIIDKTTSSLNGKTPWLTDANYDELIHVIQDALGALTLMEKIQYAVKDWVNKKHHSL